jgi:hypothetical protein
MMSLLRSEDDRSWLIVALGLYHVAYSIFAIIEPEAGGAMFMLNSSQVRLLTELLNDRTVGDWIVVGVLLAADSFLPAYEENAQASLQGRSKEQTRAEVLDLTPSQDYALAAIFRRYQEKRGEINGSRPPLNSLRFLNCFAPSASSEMPGLLQLLALHRPHLS